MQSLGSRAWVVSEANVAVAEAVAAGAGAGAAAPAVAVAVVVALVVVAAVVVIAELAVLNLGYTACRFEFLGPLNSSSLSGPSGLDSRVWGLGLGLGFRASQISIWDLAAPSP